LKINISTSERNQGILEKFAMLSGAMPLTEREKNTKNIDELTSDDYRKVALLNRGRILSKRMKI
jgi:hypothetical protein